jgi:hypothetical protein
MAAGAMDLPLAQQSLRLDWADQHMTQARACRARLAPQITQARDSARQSLGKHQALEHLLDKAKQSEARVREARSEREAMPAEPQDQSDILTGNPSAAQLPHLEK